MLVNIKKSKTFEPIIMSISRIALEEFIFYICRHLNSKCRHM